MRVRPAILSFSASIAAAVAGYILGLAPATDGAPGDDRLHSATLTALDVDDFRGLGASELAQRLASFPLEKLARRAQRIASKPEAGEGDILALQIYAERDPQGALALAQSDEFAPWWAKHQIVTILLEGAALRGTRAFEELFSQLERPDQWVHSLVEWGPHLGFVPLAELLAKHGEADSGGGHDEWSPMGRYFSQWAAADLQGAIAASLELPDGTNRRSATLGLLSDWAGRDPLAAAAWIEQQGEAWLSLNGNPIVVRRANEASHADAEAINSSIGLVGEDDPFDSAQFTAEDPLAEAPAAFSATSRGPSGAQMRRAIVGRMAHHDPAAAVELIATLPHGSARAELISAIFTGGDSSYRAQDAITAFATLEDPADRRAALNTLFSHHGRNAISPESGAEILLSLEDPDAAAEQFAWQARRWDDVSVAQEWIESLPQGAARDAANAAMVSRLAQDDPAASLALANGIADEKRRTHSLRELGTWRTLADPTTALDWINETLPPGSAGRDAVLGGAIENLAGNRHISQAVTGFDEWLANSGDGLVDNHHAIQAAQSLISQWSQTSPSAAAEWVAGLPEGILRTGAVEELAGRWLQHDPVEASEWIAQLPSGATRDSGTGQLVAAIYRDDPESALRWAASITDREQRLENAEATLRYWSRFDAESAWQAAADSGLNESEIENLNERIRHQ